MFMKNFFSGKICLALVTCQKIFNEIFKFFNETNKNLTGKMKDEFGGVIVEEFIGLKSEMYSMKKIYVKELFCSPAKGVSIASEFNKFEDVLFNEKIIRYKMKRIQSKNHKLETYKIDKYLCHALTIKDTC